MSSHSLDLQGNLIDVYTFTASLENVNVLAYAMGSWNAIVTCKSIKVMTNNTLVSER